MRRDAKLSQAIGNSVIRGCILLTLSGCAQFGAGGFLASSREQSDNALLVRRTQSLLDDLGYDAGPADGVMGARTSVAIRDYQRDNGLKPDGAPSWTLVGTLQNRAHDRLVNYIQARLAALGFFHRQPDGRDDSATRASIRAFQASKGLESDGRITPLLLRTLQVAGTASSAPDSRSGPPSVTVTAEPTAGLSGAAHAEEHRLAPGDHVTIRISDPNGGGEIRHDLSIAPDGSLALPDGGTIHAAGMRTPDLENAVALAFLERYLRNLSVKVDVDRSAAERGAPRTE